MAEIVQPENLAAWRRDNSNKTIVATNGCFDILHAGHVESLKTARELGEILIVGLNSDASVRALKGDGRPINTQHNRALVLAALRYVDAVSIFDSPRCVEFLRAVRPHVYAKGSEYRVKGLDPDEHAALRACGAYIVFLESRPELSTTAIWNLFSERSASSSSLVPSSSSAGG